MPPIAESPGVASSRSWIGRLLWIDGLAGLSAGVAVVVLWRWVVALYGLPPEIVTMIALANLTYGTYGVTLASWRHRRVGAVAALAVANAAWAVFCVVLAVGIADRATPLGTFILLFEAAFVATLSGLEWRNRHALAGRRPRALV
jgi:hypothetical protein